MRLIFCAFAVLAASVAFSAPAAAMNPCMGNPDADNCPPSWGQTGSGSQQNNQQSNTTGGQSQVQTGNVSLSTLQSEVATLQSEVAQLQTQVQALQGQRGSLQQVTPQSASTPPTLPATMRWGNANPPPHN
jgi:peptidoglycan hydrolase CwlO-like protein